mmetsp:Transcript_11911/g.35777  ORF Transcript_11911/g.35777 Transcript_11911/m.35777 type:complete len:301 (-) Transcript_11911:71-973(-)
MARDLSFLVVFPRVLAEQHLHERDAERPGVLRHGSPRHLTDSLLRAREGEGVRLRRAVRRRVPVEHAAPRRRRAAQVRDLDTHRRRRRRRRAERGKTRRRTLLFDTMFESDDDVGGLEVPERKAALLDVVEPARGLERDVRGHVDGGLAQLEQRRERRAVVAVQDEAEDAFERKRGLQRDEVRVRAELGEHVGLADLRAEAARAFRRRQRLAARISEAHRLQKLFLLRQNRRVHLAEAARRQAPHHAPLFHFAARLQQFLAVVVVVVPREQKTQNGLADARRLLRAVADPHRNRHLHVSR